MKKKDKIKALEARIAELETQIAFLRTTKPVAPAPDQYRWVYPGYTTAAPYTHPPYIVTRGSSDLTISSG